MTDKSSKAYLAKNKGKEHLYTTSYTYQTVQGYPAGDEPFVCPLVTEESYASAATKNKLVSTLSANGVDYASISEQRSVNGGAYQTISKTDFQYDEQGNEIRGKSTLPTARMGKRKSFKTIIPITAWDSRPRRTLRLPPLNVHRITVPTRKKK